MYQNEKYRYFYYIAGSILIIINFLVLLGVTKTDFRYSGPSFGMIFNLVSDLLGMNLTSYSSLMLGGLFNIILGIGIILVGVNRMRPLYAVIIGILMLIPAIITIGGMLG